MRDRLRVPAQLTPDRCHNDVESRWRRLSPYPELWKVTESNPASASKVGVNIVGPEGIRPPADDVEKTLTNWEFYPQALGIGVRSAWEHGKGTPIMVTENGIATQDDERRIDYLRGALEGLHSCIEEGIEVLAYQHWSALDNYEWASGYGPTFGLIEWDKETFARTLKSSARWYGEVARNNGV